MEKKILLMGLIVISLFILIGGSYKSLIYKIFNDYEEECFLYKQEKVNVTQTVCIRQICNMNLSMYSEPKCSCYIERDETKEIWNYTNECLKYYLVRNKER